MSKVSLEGVLAKAVPGYLPVTVATTLLGKALGKEYPKPEAGPFYQWKRRNDDTLHFAKFFNRWFVSWDSFVEKVKEQCRANEVPVPPREQLERWIDD